MNEFIDKIKIVKSAYEKYYDDCSSFGQIFLDFLSLLFLEVILLFLFWLVDFNLFSLFKSFLEKINY